MPPFRTLLADDEPDIRRLLVLWLTSLAHVVTDVAAGPAVLDRFFGGSFSLEDPFDLVICDLQMPPPGGLAVAETIRAVSAVPIILMSGSWDVDEKARASAIGAAQLQKPFGLADLKNAVGLVVGPTAGPE